MISVHSEELRKHADNIRSGLSPIMPRERYSPHLMYLEDFFGLEPETPRFRKVSFRGARNRAKRLEEALEQAQKLWQPRYPKKSQTTYRLGQAVASFNEIRKALEELMKRRSE